MELFPSNNVYFLLLPFAALTWVIISFTGKRKNKFIGLCDSRPGIVVPINFLTPRHRVVIALACAAQCSLWLGLLVRTLNIDMGEINRYLDFLIKAIVLVFLVLAITLVTYPMVACVDAPIPMVGYVLGLIYCLLFFAVTFYLLIHSLLILSKTDVSAIFYALIITGTLPQIICLVGINGWYLYKIVKGLIDIRTLMIENNDNHKNERLGFFKALLSFKAPEQKNATYVKKLLSKEQEEWDQSKHKLRSYIRKIDLPLPLAIAAAVSTVIILQLTIVAAFIYPIIFGYISVLFESDDIDSNEFRRSIQAIAALGPILSAGVSIGILCHFLYSVQTDIAQIRKGKGPFIVHIHDKMTALKLTSSTRYAGYQTASFIIGWLFYTVVITTIGFLIVLIRFVPQIFGFTLYVLIMMGLTVGVTLFVQFIVCKYLFFRLPDNKQNCTLVLNNRKVFESYTYFILLYSVATGLYTSTLRILTAITLTLLVKPRLDRLVFISPFQKLDTGYSMFTSFIITEALLNNPVMNCFVEQLIQSTQSIEASDTINFRPRNRWHLAYTLINNPGLKAQRRRERFSSKRDHQSSGTVHSSFLALNVHNSLSDTHYHLYQN